jgi:hypothetical protein
VNVLSTAAVAAIVEPETSSQAGQRLTFWLMLAASPVVAWLVFAARMKAAMRSCGAVPPSDGPHPRSRALR